MNPWALWQGPWETYLDAWSKALGGDIVRLHGMQEEDDITARHGASDFRIVCEGDHFALLDFSRAGAPRAARPTVIVTPYALHDWRVVDLANRHSLIEVLADHGVAPLYVLAWKSAQFKTRHNRIDAQFEALQIVVSSVAAPVRAVGLCQGGWLALAYAARFPDAFSRLALIGTPVDFSHSADAIGAMDDNLVDASINWLSLAGGGVIRGWSTQSLWRIKFGDRSDPCHALQESETELAANSGLRDAYAEWDRAVLDLPPAYFGDVLKQLYRDNRILAGRFHVLGQPVSLASVTCPLLIMVGRDDDIAPAQQVGAITHNVATPADAITRLDADCGHLALFLGRRTLQTQWPRIAAWLLQDATDAQTGPDRNAKQPAAPTN